MDGAVAAKLFHLNFNICDYDNQHFRKIKYNARIHFAETIAVIEQHYDFEPTALRMVLNTMLLVKTQDLVKYLFCRNARLQKQTLACFGAYYFEDVIGNPNGTDHQNIRNFMKTLGRNRFYEVF
jgi:hypothetical protein